MATRTQREERQRRVVSAEQRMTEVETGGRTCYDVPKGMSIFNPKKAANYPLDVIPFENKAGDFVFTQEVWIHFAVGPGNEAVLCPAKMQSKPCPVCEHRMGLGAEATASEATKKLIKALLPKRRELWNVYNYDEPDKGVQLWDVSFHNFGKNVYNKIQRASAEDKKKFLKFADPDEGMTIVAGGSEASTGVNKYIDFADIEFRKRKEQVTDKMLDDAAPLDAILHFQSYGEIRAKFMQEPEEDGESEAPAARRRTAEPSENGDEPAPRNRRRAEPADGPAEEPAPRSRRQTTEPEPDEAEVLEVGTEVEFQYKGKVRTGDIIGVDRKRKLYDVECDDREQPYALNFDDDTLEVVQPKTGRRPEAEPDAEEPAPSRGRRAALDEGWDEDSPAPRAARGGGSRATDDEPEDAPPQRRGRKPAEEPEEEPAPRGRRRAAAEETEPEPEEEEAAPQRRRR